MSEETYEPTGPNTDFNVDDEYKAPPLITKGTYHGSITAVKFNGEKNCVTWSVTFSENDMLCNDGETQVDGMVLDTSNWLPNPGDEIERTAKGKQTKRQAKINMLKEFAEKLKVNMNSPEIILKAIANSEWIGMEVNAKVGLRTWEGRVSNEIESLVAA